MLKRYWVVEWVANEIIVSAQGPLILGFWVLGLRVLGPGLDKNRLQYYNILTFLISSQILWIVSGFFGIGLAIGSNNIKELHPLLITMSGYLLYCAAQLLNLREIIFSIHNVNKDRRYLREGIEDVIAKRGDPDDTLRLLLRDIDNLEPLSGYGLFGVDRSTLTSMISVAITYLIILIQFKQSS